MANCGNKLARYKLKRESTHLDQERNSDERRRQLRLHRNFDQPGDRLVRVRPACPR